MRPKEKSLRRYQEQKEAHKKWGFKRRVGRWMHKGGQNGQKGEKWRAGICRRLRQRAENKEGGRG